MDQNALTDYHRIQNAIQKVVRWGTPGRPATEAAALRSLLTHSFGTVVYDHRIEHKHLTQTLQDKESGVAVEVRSYRGESPRIVLVKGSEKDLAGVFERINALAAPLEKAATPKPAPAARSCSISSKKS